MVRRVGLAHVADRASAPSSRCAAAADATVTDATEAMSCRGCEHLVVAVGRVLPYSLEDRATRRNG
jgi:hypothetical protein